MAKQFSVDVTTKLHADKLEVIEADVIANPGPNSISVAFGDNVEIYRAVEIINGWRWLWNGVRDRALLDAQFVGAILITGSSINHMNQADRRTSSDAGDFAADDVIIGIGVDVLTNLNPGPAPSTGRNATNRLESGFAKLRDFASENYFKRN